MRNCCVTDSGSGVQPAGAAHAPVGPVSRAARPTAWPPPAATIRVVAAVSSGLGLRATRRAAATTATRPATAGTPPRTARKTGAPLGSAGRPTRATSSRARFRRPWRLVFAQPGQQPNDHRQQRRPGAADQAGLGIGRRDIAPPARSRRCRPVAPARETSSPADVAIGRVSKTLASLHERNRRRPPSASEPADAAEQMARAEPVTRLRRRPAPEEQGQKQETEGQASEQQEIAHASSRAERWASCAKPETSVMPPSGVSEPPRNCSRWPSSGSSFHSASITGRGHDGRGEVHVRARPASARPVSNRASAPRPGRRAAAAE